MHGLCIAPSSPEARGQRHKLWEIRPDLHCSILGTCLSYADLLKIGRKAAFVPSETATEYEVHNYFVHRAEESDAALGDGPDIEAAKADGRWHVVFRRAWGDCPSGCIDQELSFFTVTDGEARRIEPAQARGMDAFATLIAKRGWR